VNRLGGKRDDNIKTAHAFNPTIGHYGLVESVNRVGGKRDGDIKTPHAFIAKGFHQNGIMPYALISDFYLIANERSHKKDSTIQGQKGYWTNTQNYFKVNVKSETRCSSKSNNATASSTQPSKNGI